MTNNYKKWSVRNVFPWLMCLLLFFSTGTVVQATTCPSATVINPASLPVGASITCGALNDITSANVAASALTGGCNSTSYYGGLEALYSFTPTSSGTYDISMSGQIWTAIFVFNGCPTTAGTLCIGGVSSSASAKNVTVTLTAGVTYYIMFDTWPTPNSPCPGTFTMTYIVPNTATATAAGGLWSSPSTWVSGTVPNIMSSVVIPAGSTVTVDQITSYADLNLSGTLQWNGTSNAMTVASNVTVNSGGRFLAYTAAATPVGTTVNIGGNFTNNGYANLAAGTGTAGLLNFNGTGSVLGGTGYYEGDGTRGLIRQLFFQNTGSNSISTNQNIVTHSLGQTAGSLNTNGKLTIDNTNSAIGLPFNRMVASVAVTAMGSGYTVAPIPACAGAARWTASAAVSVGNVRVTATDIYLCTGAGTTAATEPTHTSGTALNNTATFLWVGTTGTIGSPFITTALTLGNLYFLGNNLYQAVSTVATPAASAPTHTSGTVGSFRYVGTPAKVSVNWDPVSQTVRSLNLVATGSGYASSTAPGIVIVPNTTGTGATATAVIMYSLQGRAAAGLMQKTPSASITGGISFNSDGGASLLSADPQASAGVSSVYTTYGGANYTVAPIVGFAGPHTLNLVTNPGSGYTAAPTITVTGGNLVSGAALTSANFTITTNRGKVVSVYLNTGTTACYSTPPTLTLSAPTSGTTATLAFPAGSWPAATANIDANGQLTFTVTNAGYGYQTAPTVGIGATTGTANGGTFSQVATTPVSLLGMYSLTLNFFTPATVNETQLDDPSIIPANRKLNTLSLNGNSNGFKLAGDLNLYGSAPLAIVSSGSTAASSLGFLGNKLDLNGYHIFCAWNGFAGITSAFNPTGSGNGYITNGSMTIVTRGGGTTGSTLNFPYRGTTTGGTFRVFTGTGASAADGADVLNVKVTELGAPANTTTGGTGSAIGSRSFRVQTTTTLGAAATAGTNPTVQQHFNAVDGLTTTQNTTFLGEASAASGAWNIRSLAFGASGALPAAGGTITSATAAPGPIALSSDRYYAFVTNAPVITSVTPLSVCASSGSITVKGTSLSGVTAVKIGGTAVSSFTISGDTMITAIAGPGTTGVVSVVKNGGEVAGIDVVTLNPAPGAPSVTPTSASIQVGQTASFTASGTETIFNWYDAAVGGSLVFSGAGFTTPVICTNTTYYVAQNNGSCDGPRVAVSITVPSLSITPTPSNALICSAGGSVSLSVNSLPGLTYSWTGAGLNTYTGTAVVASPTTTTSYVVTASDGATCNITATVNVGVIAGSSLSPSATPASTCFPGGASTVQLNSNLSAGNFGVVSIPYAAAVEPGTGVTTITANGVPSVPLSGGSLDDGGWSGIPIGFSYNFFGTNFTTISAGTNGLLMFGTPPGYGTGAGQLGQYSFTTTPAVFPNALNPGNVIALMAADQYFGSGLAGSATSSLKYWNDGIAPTRRFIIQYQAVNSCCSSTNPTFTAQAILYETTGIVEIHIYNKNATNGSTVGLQDATKTIGAVAPGRQNFTTTITTPEAWRFIPPAAYTYSWSPTTGLSNPTAGVTDYTVSGTGSFTYNLTVTNPTTGCQVSAPVSFTVNPLPAAPTVTPSTFTVSGGSSITFTSTGEPGATFNVYDAPTGGTLLFTGATYVGAAPCANDTLWVDQNNGLCTSGSRTMVVINVIPVTAPTTNPSTQCGPGIPGVSVNAVPGAVSYSWYDAATGGTLLQSGASLTYSASISTTTTFYVAAFDGYCESARTSVVATVQVPPAVIADASDSSLCEGPNTITLAEVFLNYPTYTWSVEPGGALLSTSGFFVAATPSTAGVYHYVVTGTDGFCTNSDTVTVVVGATPPAPALVVSNTDICQGNTATLSVPVTSGSVTYCIPSLSTGCSFPDIISNVTIAGINRTSACDNLSGANGYSLFTTPTGALVAGTSNAYSVTTSGDIEGAAAWVDYNQDGVFDASEMLFNSLAGTNPATYAGTFTVPSTALNGATRMRVRCTYNTNPGTDGCTGGSTSFGETEDYTVNITGGQNSPSAMVLKYSWSPSGVVSPLTGLNTTFTGSVLGLNTVVLTITDSLTGCTNTVNTTFNVNAVPAAPTCVGDTICGLGNVTLTASAAGSGQLFWTEDNGGKILGLGNSITKAVSTSGSDYVREFPANLDTTFIGYNPIANPTAAAGYFPTTAQGMWFRVTNTEGVILKSVDIIPNGPVGSALSIAVIDSLGNTIATVSTVTTVTNTSTASPFNYQTVDLDIFVPYSTTPYAIRPVTNPNLGVHQNATVTASYPWLINGNIEILAYGNMPPAASYFGTNTFGFFYNWQVMHGCFGDACQAAYVVNPAPALNITAGGPTTFCGSGSVSLDAATASDPSYTSFSWTPGTGLNTTSGAVVTASVSATTSYIVTASDGALCQNTDTITITVNTAPFADAGTTNDTICAATAITLNGNGGSASYKYLGTTQDPGQTAGWPFNGANASQRMQVGVTAAELNAVGVFGPTYLNSIGFQVANKLSSQPYSNFTVSILPVTAGLGCFPSITYDAVGAGNIVYTGNVSTVLGWNDLVFQTPFFWDGTSDLVVNTCFTNTTNTFFDIVYTTQTPGCSSVRADNADACSDVSGTLSEFRPNLRFQGGAVNYSWSPATELSASNIANPVFTSSLGTGPRTLVLTVTDPSSSCTAVDSVSFYVNNAPDAPVISFDGDTTICTAGSVDLIGVYFDGSLQWQSSADGISFTDIPGATNDSLTYGPVSSKYVRLKAFCVDSSYSNVLYVVVYTPSVTSVENDTVCGQGNVTLNATAPSGYYLQWFSDSASYAPLASTGNIGSFTTFITQTDTFWVSATVDTNSVFNGGPAPTYCAVTNAGSACITNVTFGGINYTTAGCESTSGAFYNIIPEATATAQVIIGQTYSLSVTCDGGAITSVWIDFNQDGVFDASEWQQVYTNATTGTISITIPPTAIGGKTGMRIRSRLTGNANGAGDACLAMGSGETEDFTITIGSSACSSAKYPVIAVSTPAPAISISPATATLCAGESVTLSDATGNYPGGYSWSPASTITNSANGETTVAPSVTTTYVLSGNNGLCVNSDTIVVTVNPLPVFSLSTATPTVCGGDTATMSVLISSPVGGDYTVGAIPYAPSSATLTQSAPALGDEGNVTVNLPFNFTFAGTNYNAVTIHANGQILMGGANTSADFVYSPPTVFSATAPNNWVGFWSDLNVTTAGSITYDIVGVAPSRKLVVRFTNVNFYSADPSVSYQIELNETTNAVDVFISNLTTASVNARAIGLETATQGWSPVGYNSGTWSATNLAFGYVPVAAATVSWTGPGIVGSSTGATLTATPVANSYYVCTVTDPNTGCFKVDSILIQAGGNPKPVITTNDTSLCAPNVIDVVVADTGLYASGGYPANTTFEWFNLGGQIVPPTADLDTIQSIFGSSYYVQVVLPNGCSAISDTAYILTKSVAIVDTITTASCGSLGSILATVTSGIAPYHYVWSTDLAQTNVIQNTVTSSTQDLLSGLGAGTYYLSVADENGLPTSCTSGVITYVVGGATPITIDSVTQTSVSCNGLSDGTATVYYSGGVGTPSIQWSTGGTTATIAGLSAGTYSVIVSDGSGCADTANVTVVEPAALTGVLSSTPESSSGANDGTATVLVSGGTPGYSHVWFDLIPNQIDTGATIGGLAAGFYQVFVQDANLCQLIDTVEVTLGGGNVNLNLKMYFQGMWDGVGNTSALFNALVGVDPTECDTIYVELRDQTSPTTVLASGSAILGTNGQASFTFPGSVNGANGYIAVFHRNAVQTWSDIVTFTSTMNYDFTTAATQAYSSNLVETSTGSGIWAIYSGDIAPQDEVVDFIDQIILDNDVFNFAFGYNPSDLTGDGASDFLDQIILDNNVFNFVGSYHP